MIHLAKLIFVFFHMNHCFLVKLCFEPIGTCTTSFVKQIAMQTPYYATGKHFSVSCRRRVSPSRKYRYQVSSQSLK